MDRHALIAGVSGIFGRRLAEHLIATKGWTVTGISRREHDLFTDAFDMFRSAKVLPQ